MAAFRVVTALPLALALRVIAPAQQPNHGARTRPYLKRTASPASALRPAANAKVGGPPVAIPPTDEEREGMRDPTQWPVASDPAEHDRRSVYLMVKRSFRRPMMETFDAPDAAASCARRDAGATDELRVERAWRIALGRAPSTEENRRAVAFLARNPLELLCLLLFNLSEFLYID